jgi:hypothetical protein
VILVVLVGATTLAVASVSVWLVAPYLGLMWWIVLPVHPRRDASLANTSGAVSDLETAADADASTDAVATMVNHRSSPAPSSESPSASAVEHSTKPNPASEPALVKTKRGKGRGRKSKTSTLSEPSEATWIQVGPGKFVRADGPSSLLADAAEPPSADRNEPDGCEEWQVFDENVSTVENSVPETENETPECFANPELDPEAVEPGVVLGDNGIAPDALAPEGSGPLDQTAWKESPSVGRPSVFAPHALSRSLWLVPRSRSRLQNDLSARAGNAARSFGRSGRDRQGRRQALDRRLPSSRGTGRFRLIGGRSFPPRSPPRLNPRVSRKPDRLPSSQGYDVHSPVTGQPMMQPMEIVLDSGRSAETRNFPSLGLISQP